MQVDLLLPETQRLPARAEGLDPHAEHPRIEIEARGQVARGQHQVVKVIDQGGVRTRSSTTAPMP